MNFKIATVALAATIGAVASAQLTGNLHLVQANDGGNGWVNQEFSDFPTYSTGTGNTFTVTGGGWNIANIQQRYLDFGAFIANNVNSARLTVSQFTGFPSGNHNPIAGSAGGDIVFSGVVAGVINNVSGSLFNFEIDTTGIGALQGLANGTYLVTATPIASFGANGQAFCMAALAPTGPSWVRNPGGGFGLPAGGGWDELNDAFGGTDTELGIGINGTAVPEPATMAVLGLGAAAMLRRRRSVKK